MKPNKETLERKDSYHLWLGFKKKIYIDIYKTKLMCVGILFEVMRIATQITKAPEISSLYSMNLEIICNDIKCMPLLFAIPVLLSVLVFNWLFWNCLMCIYILLLLLSIFKQNYNSIISNIYALLCVLVIDASFKTNFYRKPIFL